MVPSESALSRARGLQRCTSRWSKSKGLLLARPAVASALLASALFLEGCGEPETCYPDGTSERAWYNCHSNVYCSNQDLATRLGSMSLADCMTQCEARDCSVIQYDCGTDCWLLDDCGSHVTSGCESSIYYRDRNWGLVTTTEATTQTQTQAGECVDVAASNQYVCSSRKYCTNQASATVLGEIPLEECLSRCDSSGACTSVQWDCGVACWLMEAEPCGEELDTVCGSSLYHKTNSSTTPTTTTDATTTTTITTTTSARFVLHTEGLTNCPSNTVPVLNESACREAATALGYTLANAEDTNQWPNGCYKWTRQPELYFNFNAGSGNLEAQVVCETMDTVTTTTTTTTANTTTSSATTLLFSLLTEGLTNCPSNTEPVLSEPDCREAATALGYTFANTEDTNQWPNGCYKWTQQPELYFNFNAGSGNLEAQVVCKESTSTTPNTTSSVQPGECIVTSAEYVCTPRKFCEWQSEAQQLGPMSLESCKVACSQTADCNAIQYDCNTDCWLLRACGAFVDTICGSSVYIRDRNWLWGTTTTTTAFGQCYPSTTPDAMPNLDTQWTCTPTVYCTNQASATRYGAMSLDRCMALCRAVGCSFIQFDCNSECWLMDVCGTFETSTCGSSVYEKSGTEEYPYFAISDAGPYRSDRFSASLYVTYSNACSGDDCIVVAVCPISPSSNLQTTVLKCQTIPPDSGDGISVTEVNCTAKGGDESVIMAEAICVESDSLSTLVSTSGYGEGDLRATCPDGYYAFSCNCFTAWKVSLTCDGYASFAPRMSPPVWGDPLSSASWTGLFEDAMADPWTVGWHRIQYAQPYWGSAECHLYSEPEAVSHRRRGVGTVQAQLSALCVRGMGRSDGDVPTVRLSYRGEGDLWPLPNATGTETQYCGWATNTKVTILRTECNPWMQTVSSDGGCSSSECHNLASCVRICNSCGFCNGIFYRLDQDSSSSFQRCYFTGNFGVESGESNEWNYGWGQSPQRSLYTDHLPDPTSAAWALYINTRDARCQRDDYTISGVTFFEDPHCTKIMVPSSMNVSGGGQTELPVDFGDWRNRLEKISFGDCYTEMQAGRKCDVEFTAAFPPNSTAPLCAIVHSSWLFGQGHSSDFGESRGWYLAAYDQRQGRVRHGTVAFDVEGTHIHMPAMQWWFRQNASEPGETIVLSSWMEFKCWDSVAEPCPSEGMFPPIEQYIREALASMLALPQHMISIRAGEWWRRLSQQPDARRLQTFEYRYNMTIHLSVEDPVQASLLPSLVATLEDMRRNFYALSDVFKTRLRHNGLRLFDTAQVMRDTVVFWIPPATLTPFPTTPSPSPSPSPTPSPTPVPSPEVPVESEEGISDGALVAALVGSIVGTGVLGISIGVFCLKKKKKRTAPGYVGGPSAVVIGSKATLRSDSKELVDPLNEMAMKSLPSYWTGGRESADLEESNVREDLSFDELLYVKHEHMEFFQELVNHTYRQITTQDRLCPTGTHDKTRGGCPCVQPGGNPGLPTGYQIKRVIRVEDSSMFTRYIDRREQIKNSRSSCEAPEPTIFTRAAMEASRGLTDILCDVDDSINEVYLWHGTQVRTGLKIAQDDFSLNYAGSGAGTMYGKGLYFTESCTKADEYAMDEPGGHYDSVRGLLLCRVCLGNFHYTLDREPSAIDKYRNGECDSTIGDRAKAVNTYREMVVYDRDQVYPEYLVLYERLQRGETPELPPKDVPFLLELPLYWKNVGRNPYTEGFREHWIVKPMIRNLIQRLADGSCGRDGGAPKVVRARRVEDSNLWCRYIDWKRSLGAQLQANGDLRCTPPNELDGNPESGHALTATILEEFHGDEAISVENMAPGLNEMLLWHGTSQKAAEAIAEEGFEVKKSGTHGRRFGHGVYLAEDLNKSLSYCSSSNNVKYVLLCRAVCGHMYYTEKHWHSDATSEATTRGKHCVLANPDRSGPREYIVLQESHVYPEYIVEFED